jgi:prepilin-type N-terminal cleavage/methylation domain-containing protein
MSRFRRQNQAPAGFTLIELLIVLAVSSLLLMAFFTLFEWHSKIYGYQEALVRVTESGRASMEALDLSVRQSRRILASHDFDGTTFGSGATALVLQLPAINAGGEVLPAKWDYVVFYQSGNKLYQRTQADPGSSRVGRLRQLSDTVSGLEITYDNADPDLSKKVGVDLTTMQAFRGHNVANRLQQNIYLLNY